MDNTVSLNFNQEQLNTIMAGLQELPFKHAAPVVDAIVKQVQEAQRPKTVKAEVVED